jgi:hypothetical protein
MVRLTFKWDNDPDSDVNSMRYLGTFNIYNGCLDNCLDKNQINLPNLN